MDSGVARSVQPLTQFLAALEKGNRLGGNVNGLTGTRVPACSSRTRSHGKSPETAKLDPATFTERCGHLAQHDIDDALDFHVSQMRVLGSKSLDQF